MPSPPENMEGHWKTGQSEPAPLQLTEVYVLAHQFYLKMGSKAGSWKSFLDKVSFKQFA